MHWLRQSTAASGTLGPFLDSTDGNTEETALTIAASDIRLSKNGAGYAGKNESSNATHQEKGNYQVALDTTDTGTLGRLRIYSHPTGALPVWQDFMIVPANVYDSLVAGSDKLDTDLFQVTANAFTSGGFHEEAVQRIADGVLKRDWTQIVGEASRSLLTAVRFLRNKWSISGTTLTITKEDDSTTAWTSELTGDASANHVVSSDPN